MSSKQLHAILNKVPAATANGEKKNINQLEEKALPKAYQEPLEENDRIVAVIPRVLKEEIKNYLKINKGATEKIIILKALKLMGFNVPNDWLVDKRTTR